MEKTGKKSITYLKVDEESVGQRLDNYLFRHCRGVPKTHIYRILRSGEVRVNKKRIAPDYRIKEQDLIRLPPMRLSEPREKLPLSKHFALPVIYEDEALLAIDKPAGLAAHGGSGIEAGVIETLRQERPDSRFLELAHRLDRDTSGILLVGKKRSALNALHQAFRESKADKRYLMLVKGRWRNPLQQVKLPLYKYLTASGERRVRVDEENGKPAHTIFCLLKRWQRFSLLEAQLKTGRTHQLRVHLAHLGYPILGDEKYGDFELNRALQKEGLKRMALHAASIEFAHPVHAKNLRLAAPLPQSLRQFIQHLDNTEPNHETRKQLEQWQEALCAPLT